MLIGSFEVPAMDGGMDPTGAVDAFVCVVSGTVGGLIIGLITEYFTSHSYHPVREVRVKPRLRERGGGNVPLSWLCPSW